MSFRIGGSITAVTILGVRWLLENGGAGLLRAREVFVDVLYIEVSTASRNSERIGG